MSKQGPFGLWMGMTLEHLSDTVEQIAPYKYQTYDVPQPHPAFESYVLQITPVNGLSWVKAIGHQVSTSAHGYDLVASFGVMEKKLVNAYGQNNKLDFLFHDSIWNEPRDWMQSLLSNERILMTEWSAEHGSSLPEHISSLALLAMATDTDTGLIVLEYSLKNFGSSEVEISGIQDGVL